MILPAKSGFLKHIIAEGIARHKSKQKKYKLKGSPVAGYGIFATQKIRKNEIIFAGEEWLSASYRRGL